MAEGYIMNEAMYFMGEYIKKLDKKAQTQTNVEEDPRISSVVLPKLRIEKPRRMKRVFQEQAHRFVLRNEPCLESWRTRYNLEAGLTPNPPLFGDWLRKAVKETIAGREIISRRVEDISIGPQEKALFFSGCWAYGRHFRILARDFGKKTSFDCGLSALFDEGGVSTEYFGLLDTIVKISYQSFEKVLFHAKWYKTEGKPGRWQTLCEDECGALRVKFVRPMSEKLPSDEPFADPNEVEQVFFVDDKINRGWKLVVHAEPRGKRVFYRRQEGESSASEEDEREDDEGARNDGSSGLGDFPKLGLDTPATVDLRLGLEALCDDDDENIELEASDGSEDSSESGEDEVQARPPPAYLGQHLMILSNGDLRNSDEEDGADENGEWGESDSE